MGQRKNKLNPASKINTKLHTVSFQPGTEYDVEINQSSVKIILKDFDSEQAQNFTEDILTQIYRFEAQKLLPSRLAELANKHCFKFNKVGIRNNKRNWGSCSSKNNISLNLQMMKLQCIHPKFTNRSDRNKHVLFTLSGDTKN